MDFKQLFSDIKRNINKKIIILAIEMIALILLLLIIFRGCGTGGASSRDISGLYKIESVIGSTEGALTQEMLEEMQSNGLDITLDVSDDGTAVMDFFGQQIDLSYDLEKRTIDIDGNETSFKYSGGKLTWRTDDSTMVFKKQE